MDDAFAIFDRIDPDDIREFFRPRVSFAHLYPDVPRPEPDTSLRLIAAKWTLNDLHGEEMPGIAADLLEAGYDSRSLRRLAGEINVVRSSDIEGLVAKTFSELSVPYPLSAAEAESIFTRQIARQVIAGERNPWAATGHNRICVFGWESADPDVVELYRLRDELDWDAINRPSIRTLTAELVGTFARLAKPSAIEKRMAGFGLLEGEGWIADDFDGPLPEDIQAAFEGDGEEI